MTETLLLVDQTRLAVILSSRLSRSAAVAGRVTETESVWWPEVRERREEPRGEQSWTELCESVSLQGGAQWEGQYHCTVTSGHLVQDGVYQSQSENKVKRLFWFNFVLNRASENFAIYYKTHCDDRCKSEVDTKDWSIKMITWIIEHICAANHLLVMYKATYSLIIQICHLNSEI